MAETTRAAIEAFLARPRFAFVGVSRHRNDFSRSLFREFVKRGYDVVPVHPEADEVDGIAAAPSVGAIDPPVDSVLVMTPPDATEDVVRECLDAGVERIWFYKGGPVGGAARPEHVEQCREAGMTVVAHECPFMHFPRAGGIHAFHGFVRKLLGTYPK